MAGAPDRILMLRAGELVPRVPQAPVLSSARCGWSNLQLERHRLHGPADSTGIIEGFQICCNLTGPVPIEWLVNGRWTSGTLNSGDLCLATHGEFRSVAWHESYDLLLLSLAPQLMAETNVDAGKARPMELVPGRGFRNRQIENICRLMLADSAAGSPCGPGYAEHLGCALAIYLARQFGVATPPLRAPRGSLPGPVLKSVCDLIEARLNTPIGLQDLAREANISRFYFSRLFQNSTGDTPYQYVLKRRVERAKEMFARGCSETEVASASGFASCSHLASVFRRWTGMTPINFRSRFKTKVSS